MEFLKRSVGVILGCIMVFSLSAQQFSIDTEKSSIKWTGEKIGGSHNGNISIEKGRMSIKGDKITYGTFTVNMKSITCTDLKNEADNKTLVSHLKSDHFFGVEKYPFATFMIGKTTPIVNDTLTIEGVFTIKGESETVSFQAVRTGNTFKATIIIDRTKFGIHYRSDSFFENLGDSAISDEFKLEVNLVLAQQ